jgi:DNA adenine methylase
MWRQNRYRTNHHLARDWSGCDLLTFDHYYHVGPTETLRNRMTEALAVRKGFSAGS